MASSAARRDKTRPPTQSRAASRKGQLRSQVGTSQIGGELAVCWCDSRQINVEVSPEFMVERTVWVNPLLSFGNVQADYSTYMYLHACA